MPAAAARWAPPTRVFFRLPRPGSKPRSSSFPFLRLAPSPFGPSPGRFFFLHQAQPPGAAGRAGATRRLRLRDSFQLVAVCDT
jgi:hypothetical protein